MKSNFGHENVETALDTWANVWETSDSGRLIDSDNHEHQGDDDGKSVIPSDDAWKKVFAAAGGM